MTATGVMDSAAPRPVHPWVRAGQQTIRVGLYGGLTHDWPRNVAWVQTAEALGFDSFWLADHPVLHGRDCWTVLAGLASVTHRIRLGSLVTCAAFRSPVLLARIVADVDRQSGGRVVLGLGAGDYAPEFAQLGLPFPRLRDRQAALEEAITVVRGVWGDAPITVAGEHVTVTDVRVAPGPVQQPHVPLVIAGGGERVTLRQVAQYADAANFGPGTPIGGVWTPEDIGRKYDVLRAHCDQLGRPFDSILRTYFNFVELDSSGDAAAAAWKHVSSAVGQYAVFTGTPTAVIEHFQRLSAVGVQYFITVVVGGSIEDLRRFGEEVLPHLSTVEAGPSQQVHQGG